MKIIKLIFIYLNILIIRKKIIILIHVSSFILCYHQKYICGTSKNQLYKEEKSFTNIS